MNLQQNGNRIFMQNYFPACLYLTAALMLSGCSSVPLVPQDGAPEKPLDVSAIPDATPRPEPRSRYGNPDSYEVFGKRYYVMDDSHGFVQRGIASWYGTKFHGRRTSSGETYDMYAMTAAHKTLPLPTYVEVINLENSRRIIVRVNDRGPFHDNRIIDLSYAAARKIGITARGTGLVEIRAIDPVRYAGRRNTGRVKTVAVRDDSYKYTGKREFYIQVGAFSRLINARRLSEKLMPLGESLVNVSDAVVNGKTVYRVRLGPFIDVAKADTIVNLLPEYGLYEHHIVVD